jgi:hypothetical protein
MSSQGVEDVGPSQQDLGAGGAVDRGHAGGARELTQRRAGLAADRKSAGQGGPHVGDAIRVVGAFRELARDPEVLHGEVDVPPISEHDAERLMGEGKGDRRRVVSDRHGGERHGPSGHGKGKSEQVVAPWIGHLESPPDRRANRYSRARSRLPASPVTLIQAHLGGPSS